MLPPVRRLQLVSDAADAGTAAETAAETQIEPEDPGPAAHGAVESSSACAHRTHRHAAASMTAQQEEHEGASVAERLIEACRRNNTDLLCDVLAGRPDADIAALLNGTTTVMGNHLYHEAASRGHYEMIDLLLDQPYFECDPVNRLDADTPLHSVIRWLNAEPPAQWPFGRALVAMMLEAGSNPRVRNRGGLTPAQLVDPRHQDLRDLIRQHEYASQNAGDFITVDNPKSAAPSSAAANAHDDDAADFSGSDDEDRAEWERRSKAKGRAG